MEVGLNLGNALLPAKKLRKNVFYTTEKIIDNVTQRVLGLTIF